MIAVQFLKEAQEDYDALDGSQKKWVEESVERLKVRGGEIGEPLYKSPIADLRGCKKLKNNNLGLRIVFRVISPGQCEIIEIIVVGMRKDSEVYQTAGKRLQAIYDKFNQLPKVITKNRQEGNPSPPVIYRNKPKRK